MERERISYERIRREQAQARDGARDAPRDSSRDYRPRDSYDTRPTNGDSGSRYDQRYYKSRALRNI